MANKFGQSRSIWSAIDCIFRTEKQIVCPSYTSLFRCHLVGATNQIRSFCDTTKKSSVFHRLFDPIPHEFVLNRLNSLSREIVAPGMNMEHYFVHFPDQSVAADRHEIIDSYIKLLAQVVGSEDEARKRIYSVSTKFYLGFGALLPEQEFCDKLQALPEVNLVIPDMYEDADNKRYTGEPFINGQSVSYDPKHHKVYVDMIYCINNRQHHAPLHKRGSMICG